jgi:hypothetical protein
MGEGVRWADLEHANVKYIYGASHTCILGRTSTRKFEKRFVRDYLHFPGLRASPPPYPFFSLYVSTL